MLDAVLNTLEGRRDAIVSRLCEFLAIPSVSAQEKHRDDVRRCAHWLADQLRFAMLETRVLPTAGHPAVVARNRHVPGRPTVLFYGHYDVQPPEPLEPWSTPPFVPTVREGRLYARGAADDKGQVWCHVEAITAWQAHGGVPVNLVVLIEGEEEVGSAHLEDLLLEHADLFRADVAVVSDTSQLASGHPAITYGLRGLVYAEIVATGPSHDLHSGIYGGAAPNPIHALTRLLASLHDEEGRVNLPGFYDDVDDLTPAERDAWARLPIDDSDVAREIGVSTLPGERGYTPLERRWARPTCDVNGIGGGYQADGAKTVIPSTAFAKLSFRLVPRQNPQRVRSTFEQAMRDRCPPGVTLDIRYYGQSRPVIVPQDSPAARLAAEAVRTGFGVEPAFIREGGSIPVVELLKRRLNVDTLLVGFGLPDDRLHSPNEKFDLRSLHSGTRTAAALYERLARLPARDARLPVVA